MRWEGPTEERIQELKKKLDDFKEKARKEKDEYEAKMKPAT
jgi:Fibronectin type III domain